ncbi:unnamed protein product [Orchesella dallaii]|uniref:Uncharacterized protein n=1 Tax=Orchesella dallaii TaxID=48710 RepID=A0ABP1Q0R5_9HEXA
MAEANDHNISGSPMPSSSSSIKENQSNSGNMSQISILIKMCAKGSPTDVMETLASCNKNINDVLETGSAPIGWTCLLYASRNLNREVMECLLENGADPNLCNPFGFSPIMAVAMASSQSTQVRAVSCARLLVGSDVSVRNGSTGTRRTLLTRAVINGAYELVKYFIDVGADPNEHDSLGGTPLNIAVFWKLKDIALHLVDSGANPFIKNGNGESCVDLAVKMNKGEFNEMEYLVAQWRHEYYQEHYSDELLDEMLQQKNISPCLSISTSYESLVPIEEMSDGENANENKTNVNPEVLEPIDEAGDTGAEKEEPIVVTRNGENANENNINENIEDLGQIDEAGDKDFETQGQMKATRKGNGGKWFLAGIGIAAAVVCMMKSARFSK